jgi:crotonobetainyl-CoA:carnitine CoA-transferase CaiB-like acyl-CoA transferase
VMADRHLLARGMLREIDHPALGPMTVYSSPLRLNGETAAPTSTSPALGENNDRLYREELGLDTVEIASLRERKII